MFDFKKFPATIRYERLNGDGEVILERDVEVFGYMRLEHLLSGGLIAFRQTDTLLKDVTLMPASEFEERFKGYVLVEE